MARIQSVGAIATLGPAIEGDPPSINVNLRLFAKIERGLLAIDPAAQSFGAGVALGSLAKVAEVTESGLRAQQRLPKGIMTDPWERVAAELKKLSVETDAETLRALSFDFVPDGELRGLLEENGD